MGRHVERGVTSPPASPDRPRRGEGFTLVELLIVIVILGVLATIVLLAAGSFRDGGVEAACAQDRRTIITAVEAYKVRHDSAPPAALTDLTTGGYLRDDGSVTAAAKSGEGYTLTYTAGELNDCVSALAAGGGGSGSGPGLSSPTITSVPQLTSGSTHNVVIVGTGFVSGASVTFTPSLTTSGLTVQDATRARFTIAKAHADPGSYAITITNPDGGTTTATLIIA